MEDLHSLRSFCIAAALAVTLGCACVRAQEQENAVESPQQPQQFEATARPDSVALPAPEAQQGSPGTSEKSTQGDALPGKVNPSDSATLDDQQGKQTKRILWIIPNYRAVSVGTALPPLNFKGKLWLATQDTFDYSDFIYVGLLAGIALDGKSQPTFHEGAAGFGRYYWRIFVDGAVENYMTEALVPEVTREDPRYYTLGKGGFFKRTGYAVSRLFITRTDSGKETFNISEVVGAGAAAGLGNAYYPSQNNQLVKTYQRWGTQVGLDGVFNILKEFWPNINHTVFHGKYGSS